MKIDVHELANTPGAGLAKQKLIAAKCWDELAGLPERKMRLRVEYEINQQSTETVTVSARSEEEAEQKARDVLEDRHDAEVFPLNVDFLEPL